MVVKNVPHISCTTNTLWTYALQLAFLEVRAEERTPFLPWPPNLSDTSLSFICSMSTRIAIRGTRPFRFGWAAEKVSSNSFWQAFWQSQSLFSAASVSDFRLYQFLVPALNHTRRLESRIRDWRTSHLLTHFDTIDAQVCPILKWSPPFRI